MELREKNVPAVVVVYENELLGRTHTHTLSYVYIYINVSAVCCIGADNKTTDTNGRHGVNYKLPPSFLRDNLWPHQPAAVVLLTGVQLSQREQFIQHYNHMSRNVSGLIISGGGGFSDAVRLVMLQWNSIGEKSWLYFWLSLYQHMEQRIYNS